MECLACHGALPPMARFCPTCGVSWRPQEQPAEAEPASPTGQGGGAVSQEPVLSPQMLAEWRDQLIDCYLNYSISKELSDWLNDLGLPPTGTTHEQLARLHRQADPLVLSAESFPRQTIFYLSKYPEEILTEICRELGIDSAGSKDELLKRIYREVGTREGWLQPLSDDARQLFKDTFLPILSGFDHNKDYCLRLWDELSDLLGREPSNVPASPAYGSAVIAVAIPNFLQQAQAILFQHELDHRTVDLSEHA
ncbi:MAG: SAP domain-containing protein [Nitrospiraceae bacterium]